MKEKKKRTWMVGVPIKRLQSKKDVHDSFRKSAEKSIDDLPAKEYRGKYGSVNRGKNVVFKAVEYTTTKKKNIAIIDRHEDSKGGFTKKTYVVPGTIKTVIGIDPITSKKRRFKVKNNIRFNTKQDATKERTKRNRTRSKSEKAFDRLYRKKSKES